MRVAYGMVGIITNSVKPIAGELIDPLYEGIEFNDRVYSYFDVPGLVSGRVKLPHDTKSFAVIGPSGGGKEFRSIALGEFLGLYGKIASVIFFVNAFLEI